MVSRGYRLCVSKLQKVLDENDANDAYTVAYPRLKEKYCVDVDKGNKATVPDVKIVAIFIQSSSSVKNSIKNAPADQTAALLAHEQLHFDLADFFARKMIVEIKKLMVMGNSPRDAKNKMIRAVKAKRKEIFAEYNMAQKHGPTQAEQQAWDTKTKALIATMLE